MTDLEYYIDWMDAKLDMTMAEYAQMEGKTEVQMKNILYRGKRAFLNNSEATLEVKEDGPNVRQVTRRTRGTLTSVEDLMAEAGMDPEEWAQDGEVLVKSWEGFIKNDRKQIETVTLWSIRAVFIRRNPVAIEPHVQPLQITFSRPAMIERSQGIEVDYETTVYIADAQLGLTRDLRSGEYTPTHDRLALDVVGQVLADVMPDTLVIGGDWMDFSGLSTHFSVKPGSMFTTQPETIESAWWLSKFVRYAGEKVYLEGNHEARMNSYMLKNAQQFYGLRNPFQTDGAWALSVENLLGLPDLGVVYLVGYPHNQYWIEDDVLAIHGDVARRAPFATTTKIRQKYPTTSVIYGHSHRPELLRYSLETGHGTKYQFCGTPGALCRLDQAVPGHNLGSDWGQGFAIIRHNEHWHDVEFVSIIEGFAYTQGREYHGQFDIDQLRDETYHTGWRL